MGHRTEVQADSPHPQVKREGEGACPDVLDVLERTEYRCRVDCMLEEGVEALSVFYPSGNSIAEGNAPHSSTLAWQIPWMEEPGGLRSMGSLRVGHD